MPHNERLNLGKFTIDADKFSDKIKRSELSGIDKIEVDADARVAVSDDGQHALINPEFFITKYSDDGNHYGINDDTLVNCPSYYMYSEDDYNDSYNMEIEDCYNCTNEYWFADEIIDILGLEEDIFMGVEGMLFDYNTEEIIESEKKTHYHCSDCNKDWWGKEDKDKCPKCGKEIEPDGEMDPLFETKLAVHEDFEVAPRQETEVANYDPVVMQVAAKSVELAKQLAEHYGWDERLVIADFLRDINIMIDPSKLNELNMDLPVDRATAELYNNCIAPAMELNEFTGGEVLGEMIDQFLQLTPEQAFYMIDNCNPRQLPGFARQALPHNNVRRLR